MPTHVVEEFFEVFLVVEVFEEAEVGDDGLDVFVAGLEVADADAEVVVDAFADDDVAGVDAGAEEGNAAFDGLDVAFVGVEGEAEVFEEEFDVLDVF